MQTQKYIWSNVQIKSSPISVSIFISFFQLKDPLVSVPGAWITEKCIYPINHNINKTYEIKYMLIVVTEFSTMHYLIGQ